MKEFLVIGVSFELKEVDFKLFTNKKVIYRVYKFDKIDTNKLAQWLIKKKCKKMTKRQE